ncbi:MAG: glycoside hydrolase family 127 protein [Lachnospiraceae bacterium]|nr:glycoside hydrolase family 127 protein [Lachnospiraceae bacterium]
MSTNNKPTTVSKPLSLRSVTVTDNFWKHQMELVRKEVIPYQWDALNDRVPDAAPSFCMRNFKIAGKITKARREQGAAYEERIWPLKTFETLPEDINNMEDRFYGFLFQDSDFAKWIEAVGYSLTQHPDAELEQIADEAIDIVCAAQQDNGYLDTYYIINDMSKIFTNLRDNHELYCFGHLTEGAVAYYQATGKDKLLNAARRYADFIYDNFGYEDGKLRGYPGHEIAEMALIRLHEVTGDSKYLELCNFFLDERGVKPYYFDKEHPEVVKKGHENDDRYHYHQAHLPVREQTEAVGHSVRAVYLYSGMADAARLNHDEKMFEACEKLWDSITNKKMYITGGIGGTHLGEAFSFNYDLPNDTAYAETCASIGLVFFARRMLEMKIDNKYSDVMERAFYNGILSGIALDGKSFFYVNPLEVLPEACHKDERKRHVKPIRQKWFGCACCPPNITRLLSSISTYAYTENEDTFFVHMYMGGEIDKVVGNDSVHFSIDSDFPWNGKASIKASLDKPLSYTLALRIPGWCNSYTVDGINDMANCSEIKNGYLYITREWTDGDTVTLNFDMPVKLMQSNTLVRENEGKLAVMRGPIVFCLEEADNGKHLHNLSIDPGIPANATMFDDLGLPMSKITMQGRRYKSSACSDNLYKEYSPASDYEQVTLTYIPYFAWNNRGEGEMQVWSSFVR